MSAPEVSLIVSTQGRRASLAAALRSALDQDFAALEIVVVDDATDGVAWRGQAAVAPLLSDPRIRLVPFHEGRGCAAAKNAGLRAARGRWVCYLDDDNEYRPDKVSAQHALAVSTGSPLVLCGLEFRMHGRRRVRQTEAMGFTGDDLLLRALPDTNVLFHRRAEAVAWNESLGTGDDACFFHATIAHHRLERVPNVPRALAIYHAHGGNRANLGFERFYRGQRCLITTWAKQYSPGARRILLLRALVAFSKYRPGGWGRLLRQGGRLLGTGGGREWRVVANALGAKVPGLRRWMVT